MGLFTTGCLIKNHADREKSVKIPRLLVDAEGTATWIRRHHLEQIGVEAEKRQTFQVADGHYAFRDVGYVIIRVGHRETTDEVVFAEKGDNTLLGPRSLAGLMLWVDSKQKKFIKVKAHPVVRLNRVGSACCAGAPQRDFSTSRGKR